MYLYFKTFHCCIEQYLRISRMHRQYKIIRLSKFSIAPLSHSRVEVPEIFSPAQRCFTDLTFFSASSVRWRFKQQILLSHFYFFFISHANSYILPQFHIFFNKTHKNKPGFMQNNKKWRNVCKNAWDEMKNKTLIPKNLSTRTSKSDYPCPRLVTIYFWCKKNEISTINEKLLSISNEKSLIFSFFLLF